MSMRDGRGRNTASGLSPDPAETVRMRFDRTTHPDPAARVRAWQAATSVSMETRFKAGDLEGFVGSVSVCPVGPYLLSDLSLTSATIFRQRATRVKWEHDHVILDHVLAGRLRGTIGGTPVTLTAGDCAMVDLRGGMHLRMDDARIIGLIIPRRLFVRQAGGKVAVDGMVFAPDTSEGKVLGSLLQSLVTEADHLFEHAPTALAQAIVDVVAACVSPPTRHQAVARRVAPAAKPPTLAQIRRFIDRHATHLDFNAGTVCARFGLSRTALYKMFAPASGMAEAIRRRRATIAVRLLAKPGAHAVRIVDIARASGFRTERSLRNVLRERYAASPREIMRDGVATAIKPEPPDQDIGRLFDEL